MPGGNHGRTNPGAATPTGVGGYSKGSRVFLSKSQAGKHAVRPLASEEAYRQRSDERIPEKKTEI
jgi:hypothetical protein